jgi:uncharacterized membrane protein YphA (DoxX/SURF4 family)
MTAFALGHTLKASIHEDVFLTEECRMNTALWVVQVLLALTFLMTGLMKVTQPIERLAKHMSWVKDSAPKTVRLIGVLEILGAVGVVLPALTGILPWLTPLAAVGLILTMIGATITHLRLNEPSHIPVTIVLLLLAAFVVYGRMSLVPIS